MISRRELFAAGVAGGFTADASTTATTQDNNAGALRNIGSSLHGISQTLDRAMLSNNIVFGQADRLRTQFEIFFRTNQKFPDFVDVGLSVFLDLYDWHIKNRQPLTISRGPDSRYWMQFMFSTLILRGEHEPNYIGIPYDKA